MSGTFSTVEPNPELGMSIGLEFLINMYSVSGLKVDSLRLFHEAYKPYKVIILYNVQPENTILILYYFRVSEVWQKQAKFILEHNICLLLCIKKKIASV